MLSQVIHDALPLDVANELREMCLAASYRIGDQSNEANFAQFKGREGLPQLGEIYTARFGRSREIEIQKDRIEAIFNPIVSKYHQANKRQFTFRAYRLDAGGHFRMHSDHEVGAIAFSYYLSKDWKWDWGGLLVTSEGSVYLPRFNDLVLMDAANRLPHCVTSVEPWAKEPRYMLAGFYK